MRVGNQTLFSPCRNGLSHGGNCLFEQCALGTKLHARDLKAYERPPGAWVSDGHKETQKAQAERNGRPLLLCVMCLLWPQTG